MATITKRAWTTTKGAPRECWIVRYADSDGRWRLKSFERHREANNWLTKTLGEVKNRTHRPDSAAPTVRAAGEAWVRRGQADGLERSTLDQRRQHLDLHILPLLGDNTKLSKIDVEAFRDELLTTRSRAMAKKVMTSFKAILRLAKMAHLAADVDRIATGGRHAKPLKVGEDIPTPAEVNALLHAAEGMMVPLLAVLVFCGLRTSEARALRWQDVDLPGRLLHVRQRADKWNAIGEPKSGTSRREVPLSPLVLSRLREWRLTCPHGDLGLVFPTSAGTVEQLSNIRNRHLVPLQVAAGVVDPHGKAKYGFHAFRHFAASWWLEQRYTIKHVSTLLGHSSPMVSLTVYAHLMPSEDEHERFAAAERALLATQTGPIRDIPA